MLSWCVNAEGILSPASPMASNLDVLALRWQPMAKATSMSLLDPERSCDASKLFYRAIDDATDEATREPWPTCRYGTSYRCFPR
jgi:hypothetical protein